MSGGFRRQAAVSAEAAGQSDALWSISRWAAVGTAAVAGGLVVGATGGFAVPAVSLGVGALATSLGSTTTMQLAALMSTPAGASLLTSIFGAAGAGLVSSRMIHRTGGVSGFRWKQTFQTAVAADCCLARAQQGRYPSGSTPQDCCRT